MISFLKFQVLHVMTSFHVTVLEISFPLQNSYFFCPFWSLHLSVLQAILKPVAAF